MYRLEGNFVVKYNDDEGDLISVTTTEELVEAFRLSQDLKPPILRITIFKSNKGEASKVEEVKEEEDSHQYPSIPISEWDAPQKEPRKVEEAPIKKEEPKKEEMKESNQYPPLPISEWDAPKKKPVLLVSVKIPQSAAHAEQEVTIPISISAQIQNQCTSTSADVSKYSRETMISALPFATTYSELSSTIAAQCKELSETTAQISKRLSSLQTEETLRLNDVSKEVADLSLATMRECKKLSDATALLCHNLSASTMEDCKNFSASSNACLVDTRSNLAELSDDIKGKCGDLSTETSARSAQASNEIKRIIMNL